MDSFKPEGFRNYFQLFILFNGHVRGVLEKIFRARYEQLTETIWEDGSEFGKVFLEFLCERTTESPFPLEKETVEAAELSKLDLMTLACLLQNMDFPSSPTVAVQETKKTILKENDVINDLHQAWHKFALLPGSKTIGAETFQDLWSETTGLLNRLGVPVSFVTDNLLGILGRKEGRDRSGEGRESKKIKNPLGGINDQTSDVDEIRRRRWEREFEVLWDLVKRRLGDSVPSNEYMDREEYSQTRTSRRKKLKDSYWTSERIKGNNAKHPGLVNMWIGGTDPGIFQRMKPISDGERGKIVGLHILLVRNYEKVRLFYNGRVRAVEDRVGDAFGDAMEKIMTPWAAGFKLGYSKNSPLDLDEKVPGGSTLAKMVKLARIFHELLQSVILAKDDGVYLCEPFLVLPGRRKLFQRIRSQYDKGKEPLDLNKIGRKIMRGEYKTVCSLETDILKVLHTFSTALIKFEPDIEEAAQKITDVLQTAKGKILTDALLSFKKPSGNAPDFIRCVCGTYSENLFLIQCQKCGVWQHGDCMGINCSGRVHTYPGVLDPKKRKLGLYKQKHKRAESGMEEENCNIKPQDPENHEPYLCERCLPRDIDVEVRDNSLIDLGKTFYMNFVREDGFVIRKNDTVYVLRANEEFTENEEIVSESEKGGKLHPPQATYKTAGPLLPVNCDIFRVESLFIEHEGKKVFGHYYRRPCETFTEPFRKFYPNEIVRSPFTGIVNFDAVHGQCWVMEPSAYFLGRPIGAKEEHVYICEFRVDRKARNFSKIGNKSQRVCMKPFAFNQFETSLVIDRSFQPYNIPNPVIPRKLSSSSAALVDKNRKVKYADNNTHFKPDGDGRIILVDEVRLDKKETSLSQIVDKLYEKVNFEPPHVIVLRARKNPEKAKVSISSTLIHRSHVNARSSYVEDPGTESSEPSDIADDDDTTRSASVPSGKSLQLESAYTPPPKRMKTIIIIDIDVETQEETLQEEKVVTRIRNRKEDTLESKYISLVNAGKVTFQGLCASLLDVEDPPSVPPQKTNYLTTGLLSNMCKRSSPQDIVPPSKPSLEPKRKTCQGKIQKQLDIESYSKILPPPAYCDNFVRHYMKDYLLPYDIWCHGVILNHKLFHQWKHNELITEKTAAKASLKRKYLHRIESSTKE